MTDTFTKQELIDFMDSVEHMFGAAAAKHRTKAFLNVSADAKHGRLVQAEYAERHEAMARTVRSLLEQVTT